MRFLAAAAAVLTANAPASSGPALPTWNGIERKELAAAGWVPGGLLLAGDADDAASQPAEPLQVEPPSPEEIAGDLTPAPAVAEKFLPAYFAERPGSFLIDPQNLLGPADFRDRLGFLNYHASDSSIDLFVYVFGGDEEIPSEVRKEELVERFFSGGRPAAIVYYYFGAPQRSVVYLSPSLTDAISAAEQHRALESSTMQALERTKPAEQIEKFLVQMSIRIYWMERMIAGETVPLPASASPAGAAEENAAGKSAKFAWIQELGLKHSVPAALLLGGLLTAFGLGGWLRQRARYRFPEFEVEPRLGGAHAAGVGAVISFASAAVPPASQRDQVPDYLRRA